MPCRYTSWAQPPPVSGGLEHGSVWTILGQPVSVPPLQNLSLRNAQSTAGHADREDFRTDIAIYKFGDRALPADVRGMLRVQRNLPPDDEQLVLVCSLDHCIDSVDRVQLCTHLGARYAEAVKSIKPQKSSYTANAVFDGPLIVSKVSECSPTESVTHMCWYTTNPDQKALLYEILTEANVDRSLTPVRSGEALRTIAGRAFGPVGSIATVENIESATTPPDQYIYTENETRAVLNGAAGWAPPEKFTKKAVSDEQQLVVKSVKRTKKMQKDDPERIFKPFISFNWERVGPGTFVPPGKKARK